MATAGAIRKSDRLKDKDENEEYVLPPPLQLTENKKSATSSTPKKFSAAEEQLDKQLEELERSISETETQLQEIDQQKKLKEKKDKIERLQKQLRRNERKIKKEKEEARRPLSVTILSDSMAKYVSGVKYTTVQAFPGATVSRLQSKILSQKASIEFKYTILLIGTNDISSSLSVGEIISLFENLVTIIRSRSSTKLIISGIIPRPCDLQTDPTESRVKSVNKELKELCKRRHIQFLHTFRIFLHKNKPIRSYFAVNDGGLHLNSEGTRRLRLFFINAVSHLK